MNGVDFYQMALGARVEVLGPPVPSVLLERVGGPELGAALALILSLDLVPRLQAARRRPRPDECPRVSELHAGDTCP